MVSGDSLAVTEAGVTSSYRLRRLSRLEVSQGRRSHWPLGAGVGFVVGAGATYAVAQSGGSTSLCDRDANQDALNSGECLGLTFLGGVVGAGLGALVGSLIHTERWRDVPLQNFRLAITTGPNRRLGLDFGARLGLTLREP